MNAGPDFDSRLVFFVLISPICAALAIYATIRTAHSGERTWVIIFWLAYMWLLPLVGPLAVLWAVRGVEAKR